MKTLIIFVTLCVAVIVSASPFEKPDSEPNTLLDLLTSNTAGEEIDAPREKRQFGFGGGSRERGYGGGYNQGFGGGGFGGGYNQGMIV